MKREVAVIIPAHDEAATIGRCLRSVLSACDAAFVESAVVVAADRCSDGTADIARGILGPRGVVLEGDFGTAGRARAAGTTWALANVAPRWLANTDADTTVSVDWVAHQLDHFYDGCGGVAGVVDVEHFAEFNLQVELAFHAYYAGEADHEHPHIHGANMGFSAEAYLASEGWQDVLAGEDVCLWASLRANGVRLLSCRGLSVTTSGRRHARATGGFATFLARLEAASV
jgi:cellulose synthase/poly-beta-1,6-N-acetylglucosamine synthase-like glycosyltransferase